MPTIDITVKADKPQCLRQILDLLSTILSVRQSQKAFYNMAAKQAGVSLNEFIISDWEEDETSKIYNEMIQQKTMRNSKKENHDRAILSWFSYYVVIIQFVYSTLIIIINRPK